MTTFKVKTNLDTVEFDRRADAYSYTCDVIPNVKKLEFYEDDKVKYRVIARSDEFAEGQVYIDVPCIQTKV